MTLKVLGIVHEHNATVCLMENGAVTFCQSEERLNRIKGSAGFPVQTLRYVYDHVAAPESIDLAVVFERTIFGYLSMRWRGFTAIPGGQYLDGNATRPTLKRRFLGTGLGGWLYKLKTDRRENNAELRRESQAYFSRELGLPETKIRCLDHHLAHAYSVVPNTWDWGTALIFTLDGYGDGLCATVNLLEDGFLRRLSACGDRHSLGAYYWDTTLLLGMKGLEDEFKVMALAPYARRDRIGRLLADLRALLSVDEKGLWKSSLSPFRLLGTLEQLYRFHRFDEVAGAIQALAEELILKWVRYWIETTGCRNVAVSGGVFMNVKACQRIAAMAEVERLFVMPSAGDESCAIGSAVWGGLYHDPSKVPQPITHLYLGAGFSNEDVERALLGANAATRYHVSKPADMARVIAGLLAQNKIVARCSGRMEFGARALGNRSILANPSDFSNVRRINEAIKGRDFWMPFAPSVLEEDIHRYVAGSDRIAALYMCLSFDSTPEARRHLVAAIHPADGTLRPQAVRKEWNPQFHEIIRCFKEKTGIGAVLNTSFNLHREPMVCSPADAIRAADLSGLEHLVLGDFLLVKKSGAMPAARTRNEEGVAACSA